MPTYQNKGDYLLVEIREAYSLDLYRSVIHEVANRCTAEGLNKVLVDFSESDGNPSILDRYTLGSEIARAWKFKIQGAGVAREETINFMMENVAVNRGANVKAFKARKEALEWLGITISNEQMGNEPA